MKTINSVFYDYINKSLFFVQSILHKIKENSFLLSNIDSFICISILLVYIFSTFAQNNSIALMAIIVAALVLLKTIMTKNEKIELNICNFYLIIYLFICFISNLTSSLPVQSFYGFSKTLLYIAFYFALCQFLKNNKKFIFVIFILLSLLVTIESFIGLFQNSIGVANISTWQDTSYVNPENVLTRVYGTLKPYNPNLFAGWMVAVIPSLIGFNIFFLYRRLNILACISIIFSLVAILCLFYTGCRGAYLALFSIFFCLILFLFNLNKIGKIISLVIAGFGGSFVILHQGIFHRLLSIFILRGDSSTSFRMNVYQSALQMFQDNPIFGVGVGNKVFREIYGLYMLSGFDALSCYSVFLEMAVESGIFSLIAFLFFVGTLFYESVKKFLNSSNMTEKIIIFTAFCSILAVMIHGLVDTIYFRPQVQFIFWSMIAIVISIKNKPDETILSTP